MSAFEGETDIKTKLLTRDEGYNSSDAGRAAYVYFEDESGRSPVAKLLTVRPADRSEHREAVVDADNLSRAV